ncbi:right-handed parallel beta-helix repeat-containing protein [Vibrio tritonius]|uniref:Right-handed parallel beta-helix repeat-containing protein n=1 Tax=Vibrio tritonius TaxID=1435069 RepID=A0ABS7YQN9_9VIBR|nr:right-handed parallel beta-helix repeat-containing protein [Vibrio tritonius]MCA2017995.1 right-handed parallel beta-helix repeat-containing protein [Vibrio tritonius]
MLLKFFKRYFIFCGLVLNVGLLYSVYSFSHALFDGQTVPGVFFKVAGKLTAHTSTRSVGDVFMSIGNMLDTPVYYWKPFDRQQWPTVGPDYASPPSVGVEPKKSFYVVNSNELIDAVRFAKPGTTIVVADGDYVLQGKRFETSNDEPTKYNPIVLKAEHPGKVRLLMTSLEGFYISRPFWTLTGFKFIGQCSNHSFCEHAIHIVGEANNVQIVNNEFVDFNAAIKVNGNSGMYPDHGKVLYNHFYSTKPRETKYSVTPINIDHANSWLVSHNIIRDFIKNGGNKVSYGVFMKGGANNGIIEDNLVMCNTSQRHYAGSSIGISAGGGGMVNSRDGVTYQTNRLIIRNNIVFHCSDVGIYLNAGRDTLINNNTLYNTTGVDLRFAESSAMIVNNIFSGHLRVRDDAKIISQSGNRIYPRGFFTNKEALNNLFVSPETGNFTYVDQAIDLSKGATPYPLQDNEKVADFCGDDIAHKQKFVGAFQNSSGCFYPTK